MDGFKPLGDLKEWHVFAGLFLGLLGLISVIILVVRTFIWIINHVTIQ